MRIVAVILLILSFSLVYGAEDKAVPFPSFTMKDLDGNLVCLDSLKGNGPIFISFWAMWCKPCIKELKAIDKLYQIYSDSGFVVLGISQDGARLVRQLPRFVRKQKFTFPILWDDGALKKKVGVTDLPTSFLLNSKGEIILRKRGYKRGEEKEFEKLIIDHIERKIDEE